MTTKFSYLATEIFEDAIARWDFWASRAFARRIERASSLGRAGCGALLLSALIWVIKVDITNSYLS